MSLTHSDRERIRTAKAELAKANPQPTVPVLPETDESSGMTAAQAEAFVNHPMSAMPEEARKAIAEELVKRMQQPAAQPELPHMPPAKADVMPSLVAGREQLISSIIAGTRELELIQQSMTFIAGMTYPCPTCQTLPLDRRPNPCPRCNGMGRVRASRIEAFFD